MSDTIRLAIVGVGNCASALVQGIEYYKDKETDGLMLPDIGGYQPGDIEIAFGMDVSHDKVGYDISEAIFASSNNAEKYIDVPDLDAPVLRGPSMDGFLTLYKTTPGDEQLDFSDHKPVNFQEELEERDVDVVINYLPTGSRQATSYYATEAMSAGCGMFNSIPEFLASDEDWARRFEDANVPIIGDDIKSQVGATIVHRTLANLFESRGVTLENTSQLNVGGNTDFLNLTQADRLTSKLISKTEAVRSQSSAEEMQSDENIHVSPSGYVGYLGDQKVAHMHLKGAKFLGAPIEIDVKLQVEDSPNSAGVAIDGIRAVKLAMDRGESGPIVPAAQWLCKSPPEQVSDDVARENFISWIDFGGE